jgi:hypothetical protein
MLNYPISSLGHCEERDANAGERFAFNLIIALGPLRTDEIASICDAIGEGVDADFASPKRCYIFRCQDDSKKKRSDASVDEVEGVEAMTSLTVSISDSDSGSSGSGSGRIHLFCEIFVAFGF